MRDLKENPQTTLFPRDSKAMAMKVGIRLGVCNNPTADLLHWGNVCPAHARCATFLLTIPTSAPDLPSHGEAPQVDHVALHTFPTKHVA